MRLKYYLRGIGIGMFVTALILSISFLNKNKMSDADVKARAKELGMVESTTLIESAKASEEVKAESTKEPAPSPTEAPTATPTEAPTPTPTEEVTPTPTATLDSKKDESGTQVMDTEGGNVEVTKTETAGSNEDPESIGKETEASKVGSSTKVTVRINSGDSSVTVSKTVENAGLVANASDFDQYLCANGYDKRLHVGTYEIPYDLTYGEIAKILVGDE